ncbi:NUDIX domain-containing protein [Candidatus Dojkabacteria bacterium]|nr:NUDIX domain-containing protein [Candidatus Dojkabacteria bacterium]
MKSYTLSLNKRPFKAIKSGKKEMKKIIYEEFGVRTEITKYRIVGQKLKGMREEKPFASGNDIKLNVGDNLCLTEEFSFYDSSGTSLKRSEVCMDTEHRVAGIIVNSKREVLLLEVNKTDRFFCFPGGHQRECESVEDCLKREMLEETGIDISNSSISMVLKTQEPGFGPETFYLIDLGNKDILYQDESLEDIASQLVVYPIRKAINIRNLLPPKARNMLNQII